jgi:tyrosine-protein phosphatase YwqE
LLRIKYHCFYLLDDEEEKRFNDDVKMMNEKINEVHELYQDLKEKYKQEALDISIFWGSPLFAADNIQRNKKQPQFVRNADNQELQLLTNQVKYAPYVNAVTTAL